MLWENWRLTRVEAAVRLVLGFSVASGAIVLFEAGPTVAFGILLVAHSMIWLSISKLNGGRFLDGYKPGFPLYLLYTRPVPTVVFVAVAMAYDAFSCALLYVLSAGLVRLAFGLPIPLFSLTAWIVAVHFGLAAFQWSTRNRIVQSIAPFAVVLPFFFVLYENVAFPLRIEFSPVENATMALFCLLAFVFTVAGVARQRRGEFAGPVPRKAGSGGYHDRLFNLVRFSCPTSSQTSAQVWFELKSSGLSVLTIGLAFALLIVLLFAIGSHFAPIRPFAVLSVIVSVPAVLLLGVNAFGIRRRQGRSYLSAFEATQPHRDARLAGIKIVVRSSCVFVALLAIAGTAWASTSLARAWGSWVVLDPERLVLARARFDAAIGGSSAYLLAAMSVVAFFATAFVVGARAALTALRARYSRRVHIAVLLLMFYVVALVAFAWAAKHGSGSENLLAVLLRATGSIVVAASVLGTAYLLWRALDEQLFTLREWWGVVFVSAALGVVCALFLQSASLQFDGMTLHVTWVLSFSVQPLLVAILAPWSLNRIRHA